MVSGSERKTKMVINAVDNFMGDFCIDDFAEYQDQAFLDLLGIKIPNVSLSEFWPSRGSVGDGLGKSETGTEGWDHVDKNSNMS